LQLRHLLARRERPGDGDHCQSSTPKMYAAVPQKI
jgi:hypothetical protein